VYPSGTAIYPCVERSFGGYGVSIQIVGIWGVFFTADFSFFRPFRDKKSSLMCFQHLNVACISLQVRGKERKPAQNQAQLVWP